MLAGINSLKEVEQQVYDISLTKGRILEKIVNKSSKIGSEDHGIELVI